MGSTTKTAKQGTPMRRYNTRLTDSQIAFIKAEAKRSKGTLSEGDVHRQLLDEAISKRKSQ